MAVKKVIEERTDIIRRLYVEKKPGYNFLAKKTADDVLRKLNIKTDVRIFLRYDVTGLTTPDYESAIRTVFSEPPVDTVYTEELPELTGYTVFAVEYLPGQYDQRADSCAQCIQLLTKKQRPKVACATVYAFTALPEKIIPQVKKLFINPVESREASMTKPESLDPVLEAAGETPVVPLIALGEEALKQYHNGNFAMSLDDLRFVRDYFLKEKRDPTETELKVLDTYWSDHCRHTTFLTQIISTNIKSKVPHIKEAFEKYNSLRKDLYKNRDDKYISLMDIATIGAKALKKEGRLPMLDESDEINACSINVKSEDGDWLVMFKNETHNHPTEIEPFGGAATCLGGAIRDPLSGRSYVFQSMRISGAADPNTEYRKTLAGKLPQSVITTTAAQGFSSYGNQIGLATGHVSEVYHSNYAAKRLETGFVVGAAKKENVIRAVPEQGDIVVLIGGETGRDGCGGATGSSKAHTVESLSVCGAEVQKGNPITERKIQRLFRNPDFSRLVKRCNDFGAGGVCVAIGELADGIDIYLDNVFKKYEGLSSTELAISESQERMAVVIASEDFDKVLQLAETENVMAAKVAVVTDSRIMRMFHNGHKVVDLKRSLLSSNGVRTTAAATINDPPPDSSVSPSKELLKALKRKDYEAAACAVLSELNNCSQKGLIENFDSTVGAGTVLMPLGGKHQLIPTQAMAAKLPVLTSSTNTAVVSAFGFDPYLVDESPFIGSVYSIMAAVAKCVAAGAEYDTIHLSLQEFFKRLRNDPVRWGAPMSALLGALTAQLKLGIGAIGGKDSMSGTFEKIDVPNTLIAFALGIAGADKVISNVFTPGIPVYIIKQRRDSFGMPDLDYFARMMRTLGAEIARGKVKSCSVTSRDGAFGACAKSALGDGRGFLFMLNEQELFMPSFCDIIFQTTDLEPFIEFDRQKLGEITGDSIVFDGCALDTAKLLGAYAGTLEGLFPTAAKAEGAVENLFFDLPYVKKKRTKIAKPRVFIPVFPGTNCEIDTARMFEDAGAVADIFVMRNANADDILYSADQIAERIKNCNILALPGGFSAGDEPDGSAKFIAATLRNNKIAQAILKLISRDGLIIGICNGFQALVKLGLLPGGVINPMDDTSATLTFNNIGRHVSTIGRTRICSNISPWLMHAKSGKTYIVPVSHGEGRFVCSDEQLRSLIANGQIFSQYVDYDDNATMKSPHNPNGSMFAIEGITSVDGRILGKMGHTERMGKNLIKNVEGDGDIGLFQAGVDYFN